MAKRVGIKMSRSVPVLGLTSRNDETVPERKEAWKKENPVSTSTTKAPVSSQRKMGNLLPGLLLAPVVGKMSLGNEREEKTDSRNSQQTGKKTLATSPQKLKKSMKLQEKL